ncbi:MAG: GIY-YIG nuclease family protein [Sphingobacteriaceae bacterium]|nr:GIY-YIG nuclease family protein [Sphingobacteriaceae bacterium]
MAAVYILFSAKINKYYTGSCLNVKERILEHKNKTYIKSFTSVAEDWVLYFSINDLDETVARKIEKHIKAMKSKKYIENLCKHPEMIKKLIIKFSKVPI